MKPGLVVLDDVELGTQRPLRGERLGGGSDVGWRRGPSSPAEAFWVAFLGVLVLVEHEGRAVRETVDTDAADGVGGVE